MRKSGYYWIARTVAPLALGGRDRWIAFFDGYCWQLTGDDRPYTEAMFANMPFEVVGEVEEQEMTEMSSIAPVSQTPEPGAVLTTKDICLLHTGDWLIVSKSWGGPEVGSPVRFDGPSATVGCVNLTERWLAVSAGYFTFLGRPDADGWIVHDGGENPAPGMEAVEYLRRDGFMRTDEADAVWWEHKGDHKDPVAWRPRIVSEVVDDIVIPQSSDQNNLEVVKAVAESVMNDAVGYYDAFVLGIALRDADNKLSTKAEALSWRTSVVNSFHGLMKKAVEAAMKAEMK